MDKLSSRKLWIAIGLTTLCTWLLTKGLITGQVWADFMSVNVIGFMIGNVGEHWSKRS